MANTKYDSFRYLKKGQYDWQVQARVMNLWRGYSTSGQPFTSFNLLLLDSQRYRVHAFVPGNLANSLEKSLVVGSIYLFQNFTVKEYSSDDKFRCLHKDIQIVFDSETRIKPVEDNAIYIEQAVFDFYDLADLKQLSKQTTYLTDVIGVMKDPNPTLNQLTNRFGHPQTQIKFDITDGRTTIKVTFWDAFADLFAETLKLDFQYPLIIILGCCRVNEWKENINLSNVAATTFYLNSSHRSVAAMRKMLKDPEFADFHLAVKKNAPLKMCTVEQIKQFGIEELDVEVLCFLKIDQVPVMETWFYHVCTSCYKELKLVGKHYYCMYCKRNVPHPEKWFELWVLASDETGQLDLLLGNQPCRKCFGMSVREVSDEEVDVKFPTILKNIENKEYTMKIKVRAENIIERSKLYVAKDVMEGPNLQLYATESEETQPKPVQESYGEVSGCSYHLESMSENQ